MSDQKQNPAEQPEELNDEQLEDVAGGIVGPGGCIEPIFPPIIDLPSPDPIYPPEY